MKNQMQIELIPITDIEPYENNAKLHPQEQIDQIVSSIRQFGNNDPIAIDEKGTIIEGHGRLLALKQMGETDVPVIRLSHLTDEQKRAYILVHNKLTMNTGFDEEILQLELGAILDIDMEEFGFDLELADIEEDEVIEDEDFDPTPPEEPKTKRGDLYRLGRHFLLCGDSTDARDVSRLMAASGETIKVDAFISDPPYGVSYTGGTDEALTIQNDQLTGDGLTDFLIAAFANADAHLNDGGAFYIWHASSTVMSFLQAMQAVNWKDRQQLIWKKSSLVIGRQDYQWIHEPALYGWKEGAAHNWYSDRKQTTVLEFDKPARNGDHPTMKPVPLIAYLVGNSVPKDGYVLDLFGGSGTTLIAAEQLGRSCYICELDERYADVIVRRYEELTGEPAELIGSEEPSRVPEAIQPEEVAAEYFAAQEEAKAVVAAAEEVVRSQAGKQRRPKKEKQPPQMHDEEVAVR